MADFSSNYPLIVLIFTALAALIAGAPKNANIRLVSMVAFVGLVLAGGLSVEGMTAEGPSFGSMILHGVYPCFFTLLFCLAGIVTLLLSEPYLQRFGHPQAEYTILLLFATVGMVLMASANDLITVFLGIELMSICLYVLAGFFRTEERSNEASLKYFLLGAFATGFLLYGIALVYGSSGTTNLTVIGAMHPDAGSRMIFTLGATLIAVGLSFKVAAVPFHMWAPDVYEGAPTPVTAFMSTGAKAAAFAAFLTVFSRTLHFGGSSVAAVIAVIAASSMIVGNVVAISQSNIKRMLAYSSIAHAGYMLSGVAAGSVQGEVGVMFYLSAYAFMNLGAFGVISVVERDHSEGLGIDSYAGLSRRRPLLAGLMALFMFSLAGIPPFAGFFGKYYVFLAAIDARMTWLAIVGVLTSVVSAYYYLRIVVVMYFQDGEATPVSAPARPVLIALILSALMTLQFGIYPSAVLRLTHQLF